MKILKRLEPKIFRQFNHYLLTHHPFIWRTRVQYFLFYSLLAANGVLALIALLIPVSLKNVPDFESMFGANLLLASLGGIVYLLWIFLLNRDTQQLYSPARAAQALGLYLAAIACLFSNTLTIPLVLKNRVNALVDSQQLAQDLEYLSYEFWELTRFRHYQDYLRNNESITLSYDLQSGTIVASNMHLNPGEYLEVDAYEPSDQDISKALSKARTFKYAPSQLLIDALEVYGRQGYSLDNREDIAFALGNRRDALESFKKLKGINPEFHRALIQSFQETLSPVKEPENNQMVISPIKLHYNAALYASPLTQQFFDRYQVAPLEAAHLIHKLDDLDHFDLMNLLPIPHYHGRLFEDSYCREKIGNIKNDRDCYQQKLSDYSEDYRQTSNAFLVFLLSFGLILSVVALQASMLGTMSIQKLALIAALSILGFISLAFSMEFIRELESYFNFHLSGRHREITIFFTFQVAILGLLGGILTFLNKFSGQRTHFLSVLQTSGLILAGVCHLIFWIIIQNDYYHMGGELLIFQVLMALSGLGIVWLSFQIQRRISALPRKS